MKSSITPTKQMIRRMEQDVYQESIDCMSDNLAATLIVLNEEFGFGEKRIKQFIEATSRVVKRFRAYKDNELARDKFCEDLKAIGIDPDEIYFNTNFILDKQDSRVEERNAVSISEAAQMQKQLELMKKLQEMKVNSIKHI